MAVLQFRDLLSEINAFKPAQLLYKKLTDDYNKLIRPVGQNRHQLTVYLGLKLSQLIDVVSSSSCTFRIQRNAHCKAFKMFSIYKKFAKLRPSISTGRPVYNAIDLRKI